MKNIVVLLALLLNACASMFTSSAVLPSGKVVHTVRCSSYSQSNVSCLAQANRICTQGYYEHKELSYIHVYAYHDDGIYMPAKQYMAVECKDS